MVLTKTLRTAEYWFNGNPNSGIPLYSELQEYKRVGFNCVIIVEIIYNNQMNDFEDILNNRKGYTLQNNPLKTCIEQIKSLNMDAYVLLNPVRYGGLHNFLITPLYRNRMLNHIQYLIDYTSVDGIQLEEPTFENQTTLQVMDFFRECRSKIPSNIMFCANNPSNGIDAVVNHHHWNLNEINTGTIFDFVSPQPQGETTGNYPNSNMQGSFNSWITMLPNIPMCLFIYIWSQGKNNPSFYLNVEYMASKGYNIQIWPSSNMSNYSQVKTIFDTYPLPEPCPRPQFIFNINQVQL